MRARISLVPFSTLVFVALLAFIKCVPTVNCTLRHTKVGLGIIGSLLYTLLGRCSNCFLTL